MENGIFVIHYHGPIWKIIRCDITCDITNDDKLENNVSQIENASENRIVNRLDLALLYGHNNHENKFEEYSNDETIDKNNVINPNHNIDANIYGFIYVYHLQEEI